MNGKLDLSQLAFERKGPSTARTDVRRRWLSRYLLPAGIVLAFGSLLAWAAKDSLLPSQSVTIVPVLVAKAQVQKTGAPLFQAAGWIEPQPAAIVVSSLAPGVIDKMLVVEGQSVKEGEPLAKLLDTDARLQLAGAQATFQLHQANVQAAQNELESAKLAIEQPVKLQADAANAQSELAKLDAELAGLPAVIDAAQKGRELAEENVLLKRDAGEALSGQVLRRAEAERITATAESLRLTERQPILMRQRSALHRKVLAVESQLKLKLEEHRRVSAAEAALKAAEARLAQSRIAVESAELQLRRMVIPSPINGRVLSVQATRGKRVVGIDPHSEQGASAVATLYEPAMLQVRVDVRLEDLPHVSTAQEARIETASVPGGLIGRVISVTSAADIQKNTLQVKVAVDNPPDLIRPEMLAQVTFLTPEQNQPESNEQDQLRVLIPRRLVSGGEGDRYVWLVNQSTDLAERRAITLGPAGTEDLVEVISGLAPTDKLVYGGRESMSTGKRVRISGLDTSTGSGLPRSKNVAELKATTKSR